ncbi:MAG: transglutaminase domain-containing protein [Candidatus Thermoplasmatota archaeon]|nr:transglutaminase domain-containing protein [Candidatus Thermoplasmatota archaeon]
MTSKNTKGIDNTVTEEDWDLWEEEDDIIDDDEEEEETPDAIEEPDRKVPDKGKRKKKPGSNGMDPKAKKGMIWAVRVFVIIIVVILLFAPGFPFHDIRETTGINSLKNLMKPFLPFPEWTNVSVTLAYDVVVSGGRATEIEIHVATPFDIPFDPGPGKTRDYLIQDVQNVQFTPSSNMAINDWNTEKNVISGWVINNIRGEFRYEVTIDMTLHAYQWDIDEEDSGTLQEIPVEYVDRYCVNAWAVKDDDGTIEHYRYEPLDPVIKRTAEQLTSDEPTVLGKVKAIFEWMEDHFNYTSPEERQRDRLVYGDYPKWATGCLSDWYGDCDDQSLLMASLCRAVGIPAWLEIGYLYDPSPTNEDPTQKWGGHGWFSVLIPLKDSDDFVIANIDPVNHEFLFRDPYRFTDWVDDGTYMNVNGEDVYNLDYYYNYFSSSAPSGVVVDPSPSTISNSFERHGSIKVYTDRPLTDGNLPGTQQQFSSLPTPSPLLLAPLSLLFLAVPIRRAFLKRDQCSDGSEH